jgi:hypothetical protein
MCTQQKKDDKIVLAWKVQNWIVFWLYEDYHTETNTLVIITKVKISVCPGKSTSKVTKLIPYTFSAEVSI